MGTVGWIQISPAVPLGQAIKWRPKFIPDSEIRDAALSLDDARLTIARYYDFVDWTSLAAYITAVSREGPVFEFESAVEAAAWALEVARLISGSVVQQNAGHRKTEGMRALCDPYLRRQQTDVSQTDLCRLAS
jgi:hypothetical protein